MQHNKEKREQILQALNWRYATKIFDPSKKVDEEDIRTVLEAGRLSPSAIGIEAWKFFLIKNKEVRARIFEVSKQPKVLDASHLIVIAYRTDVAENIARESLERTAKAQHVEITALEGLKKMLEGGIKIKKDDGTLEMWTKAQSYIPLGIMIQTASLLGIDNGPMEGFDPNAVDEILGLKEKNLKSITMLALGYRGEDPTALRSKVRREFNEVVEVID